MWGFSTIRSRSIFFLLSVIRNKAIDIASLNAHFDVSLPFSVFSLFDQAARCTVLIYSTVSSSTSAFWALLSPSPTSAPRLRFSTSPGSSRRSRRVLRSTRASSPASQPHTSGQLRWAHLVKLSTQSLISISRSSLLHPTRP